MSFLIIKCTKCQNPQYIRKDQKYRICPKCNYHIPCQSIIPLQRVNNETEAIAIIKSLKIPNEMQIKIDQLKKHINSKRFLKTDQYFLFNNLIMQLISIFPNALPKSVIISKASEFELDISFIEHNLQELENNGYILHQFNSQDQEIIKFINFPIDLGKIHIKKPTLKVIKNIKIINNSKGEENNE